MTHIMCHVAVACALHVGGNQAPPPSDLLERVATAQRACEEAHAHIDTVIDIQIFAARPLGQAPDESPLATTRTRFTACGQAYRAEDLLLDSGKSGMPAPEDAGTIQAWNGGVWWEWYPAVKTLRFEKHERTGLVSDCISLFNGRTGPSFAERRALADVLESAEVIEASFESGRFFLRLAIRPDRSAIVDVEGTLGPPYRLERIVRYALPVEAAGDVAQAIYTISFSVEEWQEGAEFPVPMRAIRVGKNENGEGRAILERRSLEVRDHAACAATSFEPTIEPGIRIDDFRLKLRYEIGASEVTVDGDTYPTLHPIAGVITEQLPHLINDSNETGGGG